MAHHQPVAVIGLGTMGSTLARLLLQAGHPVTVHNRSAGRAEALRDAGAAVAPDAASAVAAARLVVVCVSDYAATRQILAAPGVAQQLRGRIVVNLSTAGPQDARDEEAWLAGHGAALVAGAIQAAPAQMGQPDTPILVSGPQEAFDAMLPVLKVFAGGIEYLGAGVGLAPAMDLATLSYVYGATLGVVHGACVAEAEGLPVDRFGQLVAAMSPTFGQFFAHEARVIHSGDFRITESPLRISIDATARIAAHARAHRIDARFPELVAGLFRAAADAGYADEEAVAVVKLLRPR
jgi:3-hydroxyisobutyrate dehydrogenase-like beta-hydroxyacid dehydrogenase